ncbi:hypothetical protein J7I98_37955 [Streptomyces sp. ISL-98]|uniref:hypothetical protein n=1 Tax=Streptomyces sp. ISL-98 TaxID=2819192 RepID=UPI001BE668A5|nr:hypothetical protein [Streptomyces sp. ISL-98]MBT2511482.1 hypothetical protein [Streptomyces sp. ISL-98]
MARHPLTLLRASVNLSHPAYARLVAETHADLGFGHMAARREKVSRWESGRTVPELTAQIAIAHIHQVPEEAVTRLGWPYWLHLATSDAALLTSPWTPDGAIDVLHGTARRADAEPRSYLAVTGSAVASLSRASLAAVADWQPPPARDGRRVAPDTAAWIETRIEALEAVEPPVSPAVLYPAARAEFRLITGLLAGSGYDRKTGTWLFLLAARAAALCGWFSDALGEEARGERYYLAAIRAATTAGARRWASVYLSNLAASHLAVGDPRDAVPLIGAARAIARRPSPRLTAALYIREARTHARLGEAAASTRALDHAASTLAAGPGDWDPTIDPFVGNVDEDWLARSTGITWLQIGRPERALRHFTTLLDDGPSSHVPTLPFLPLARDLLHVVDAQIALGELEAAVHSAGRAVAVFGSLPIGLLRRYRQRFAPHRGVPAVRDLFDLLEEQPLSSV